MRLKWLAGLIAVLIPAPSLMAGVATYTYTGNDFELVFGVYTTSDFVTGYFTVASVLPANLVMSPNNISPTAYSFTDGVQTFSSAAPPTNITFSIGTDGSGNIDSWDVNLGSGPPLNDTVSTESSSSDVGEMDNLDSFGETIGDPGGWTETSASTPEPASLGLIGMGAVALGLVRRRAKRAR